VQTSRTFHPVCNVDPRITSTAHECDSDYFVFLLQQFAELGFCGLANSRQKSSGMIRA
jgi:hypothetical protein